MIQHRTSSIALALVAITGCAESVPETDGDIFRSIAMGGSRFGGSIAQVEDLEVEGAHAYGFADGVHQGVTLDGHGDGWSAMIAFHLDGVAFAELEPGRYALRDHPYIEAFACSGPLGTYVDEVYADVIEIESVGEGPNTVFVKMKMELPWQEGLKQIVDADVAIPKPVY